MHLSMREWDLVQSRHQIFKSRRLLLPIKGYVEQTAECDSFPTRGA